MIPTILLAFGFVNGMVLGGVLLKHKNGSSLATKLFAWVVFLFALGIGQELVEILSWHSFFPHVLSSTDGFILLIYPLLYLYALVILGKRSKLYLKDLWHSLPFVAFSIYLLPYYTLSSYEKLNNLHSTNFDLLAYLKAIPIIIYLILIVRLFYKHTGKVDSTTENSNIKWFKIFIWLLILIGNLGLIIITLENYDYHFLFDSDTIIGSMVSIVIYGYSFLLIKQPFKLLGNNPQLINSLRTTDPFFVTPSIPYRNSPLSFEEKKKFLQQIKQVIEIQKLYLNPTLSPSQLAEITKIKPHHLSQIINEGLKKNFYTFINEYRVDEVKRLMNDPSQNFKTLLALGLESGFNSKSSFNRIFKEHTGLTPSQYKKQIWSK